MHMTIVQPDQNIVLAAVRLESCAYVVRDCVRTPFRAFTTMVRDICARFAFGLGSKAIAFLACVRWMGGWAIAQHAATWFREDYSQFLLRSRAQPRAYNVYALRAITLNGTVWPMRAIISTLSLMSVMLKQQRIYKYV